MGAFSLDTKVFFGRLPLNFDSIVSVDVGVMATEDDSENYTMGVLSLDTSVSSVVILLNILYCLSGSGSYDNKG